MNTQDGWPARLTRNIAAQIKHHRTRPEYKMSAQQISDACTALGVEVTRSMLADLENGRRANISVAEMLVIAYVIGVAPAELLLPIGTEGETELLPGLTASTTTALRWISGQSRLADTGNGHLSPGRPALGYRDMSGAALLDQHDGNATELRNSVARADGTANDLTLGHVRMIEASLRAVRDEMRHRDMALPPLDSDLEYIDAAGAAH